VLDPRNPPLTNADRLQTINNPKEVVMTLNQETTTLSAIRPLLRVAPDQWEDSYPSSHLPLRLTATTAGVLAVVVGAWGGIAPYIGHAIRYSADGSATWTWNLQHGLLSLLPGAMAVVGGLLLIASTWAPRERASVLYTVGLMGAAVILGLSAVWFLIGASVWPIYFTSHVLTAASPVRTLSDMVGYYLAEGFVLAAVAGVVGSWAVGSLPKRSNRVTY
jgi:hypothetical protein